MDEPTGQATTAPIVADDVLGLGDTVKGGRLGAIYDLVALRTGEHPGFSRVVWELAAQDKAVTSAPLWEIVEQGNETLADGADRLEGKVHIRLRLADTYAMDFVGALSADLPANPLVHGVRLLPVEDDSSLYFAIDLAEAAPYKVSVLEAPLRVVIDVYRP